MIADVSVRKYDINRDPIFAAKYQTKQRVQCKCKVGGGGGGGGGGIALRLFNGKSQD